MVTVVAYYGYLHTMVDYLVVPLCSIAFLWGGGSFTVVITDGLTIESSIIINKASLKDEGNASLILLFIYCAFTGLILFIEFIHLLCRESGQPCQGSA